MSRIHDIHLGIVKSKLLARTLIYWSNWNIDVTNMCKECTICRENQAMPDNVPKYTYMTASHVGEVFGIDVAENFILCVWITNHVVSFIVYTSYI